VLNSTKKLLSEVPKKNQKEYKYFATSFAED